MQYTTARNGDRGNGHAENTMAALERRRPIGRCSWRHVHTHPPKVPVVAERRERLPAKSYAESAGNLIDPKGIAQTSGQVGEYDPPVDAQREGSAASMALRLRASSEPSHYLSSMNAATATDRVATRSGASGVAALR